jgi:GT2 family glycosyltransferase
MDATKDSGHQISISIVSHGQGKLIAPLLDDLAPMAASGSQIILTLNIEEDESFFRNVGYQIEIIRNSSPKGFGANHNQAFARSSGDMFVVLNPDVRCKHRTFLTLLEEIERHDAGIGAPVVLSPTGSIEDSVRKFPTILSIMTRTIRRAVGKRNPPDYSTDQKSTFPIDWAAGMFLMIPSNFYRELRGFDEKYFMYLEDADLCRRAHLLGKDVICVPSATVVHDAQRASFKSSQHLKWHLQSLARFLFLGHCQTHQQLRK